MKESDLAEVTEIEKQQFPESPWPESAFIYEMKGNPFAFLYCYEKDGKVAGYADLWITYDQAQIADIAVRPEYTGMANDISVSRIPALEYALYIFFASEAAPRIFVIY